MTHTVVVDVTVVSPCRFDVVDLHHAMRRHIPWRLADGIHWNEAAHRKISNILLRHICDAWNLILPRRFTSLGDAVSGSYTGYNYLLSSQSEDSGKDSLAGTHRRSDQKDSRSFNPREYRSDTIDLTVSSNT